jgi:hypothetical protein
LTCAGPPTHFFVTFKVYDLFDLFVFHLVTSLLPV